MPNKVFMMLQTSSSYVVFTIISSLQWFGLNIICGRGSDLVYQQPPTIQPLQLPPTSLPLSLHTHIQK